MNLRKKFYCKIREAHSKFCSLTNSFFGIDDNLENRSSISPSPPGHGSRHDGTWKELIFPLAGVVLFAIPSVVVLLPEFLTIDSFLEIVPGLQVPIVRLFLVIFFVIIGIFIFLCHAARSGGQDTNPDMWPLVERAKFDMGEDDNDRLDIFLAEYQTVAKEARYRDRLLLRTGYFSLTAFAVLMTVYLRAKHPWYQTGIAMVATLISLAFAIAVVSYKDARDPLWERMRVMELHHVVKHKLTSFHTIRTRGERRLFDHLSLSGYIVTLQIFFLVLWLLVYLMTAYIALGSPPPS